MASNLFSGGLGESSYNLCMFEVMHSVQNTCLFSFLSFSLATTCLDLFHWTFSSFVTSQSILKAQLSKKISLFYVVVVGSSLKHPFISLICPSQSFHGSFLSLSTQGVLSPIGLITPIFVTVGFHGIGCIWNWKYCVIYQLTS